MITTRSFITYFILYIFTSAIIALSISFTSAAWIVYFFSLLPFYLICILYCLNLYVNHRHQQLTFKISFLYPILFQSIFIVTSPAECHFWHQGRACYSFIQSYLDITQLDPPHWYFVEIAFPISLLLYILSTIAVLKNIQSG
jgi:hypothetical protein